MLLLFSLSLKEQLYPTLQKASDPKMLFHRLHKVLILERKKRREANEQYSYDDFLEKMKIAIQNPKFTSLVQEKYQAAIIDEFQDTDAIQLGDLFYSFCLSKKDGSFLFLLEIPSSRSIPFESADLYTYLKSVEIFWAEESF